MNLLLQESRREGFQFVTVFNGDYEAGTNRFEPQGEALFGAYLDETLIGICGLNQDPYTNDPAVGRVRRLYVLPAYRKSGAGKLLVAAVIEEARRHYVTLVLNTDTEVASAFCLALEFDTGSGTPHVTHRLLL